MISDKDRIEWLVKRVKYLEHDDANGRPAVKAGKGEGQYWPQTEEDFGDAQDEECVGLELIDYIDEMVKKEASPSGNVRI